MKKQQLSYEPSKSSVILSNQKTNLGDFKWYTIEYTPENIGEIHDIFGGVSYYTSKTGLTRKGYITDSKAIVLNEDTVAVLFDPYNSWNNNTYLVNLSEDDRMITLSIFSNTLIIRDYKGANKYVCLRFERGRKGLNPLGHSIEGLVQIAKDPAAFRYIEKSYTFHNPNTPTEPEEYKMFWDVSLTPKERYEILKRLVSDPADYVNDPFDFLKAKHEITPILDHLKIGIINGLYYSRRHLAPYKLSKNLTDVLPDNVIYDKEKNIYEVYDHDRVINTNRYNVTIMAERSIDSVLHNGDKTIIEYELSINTLHYLENKTQCIKDLRAKLKNKIVINVALNDNNSEYTLSDDTVITIQDSLDAGNCMPGSERFIQEFNLPDKITYGELKAHPEFYRMLDRPEFTNVLRLKYLKLTTDEEEDK